MKLKSTQLRRYNRVLHNGIEKTIECVAPAYVMFREDCPDENTFGKWVDLDEVEFIPLTEEWLLKLGFQKREGQTYYHLKLDKTWVSLDSILVKWYGNDVGGLTMIDYVHQLQNLFFALEGEELQLKY